METLKSFFSDMPTLTHAKVGIYGAAGTGKTRTAIEIAIGLYKYAELNKPIVFFDTENGSDWVIPLLKRNNITCFVKKSRTFIDLMTAIEVAEREASILIIDSISHVWRELCDSFLQKYNADKKALMLKKSNNDIKWVESKYVEATRLEFQHWNVIKPMWAKFTQKYLQSNLHIIVCGRAGDIYEYVEDQNGKRELQKTGSKMATEKELAYEPSLLIEMIRKHIEGKDELFAVIEKDRSDTINGKEFNLPNFSHFKSHFDFISIGKRAIQYDLYSNKSNELFEGKTLEDEDWINEKKQREILCEEIEGVIKMKYPGQTSDDKQTRLSLLNDIFGSPSWKKVESLSSEKLKIGLEQIRKRIAEV